MTENIYVPPPTMTYDEAQEKAKSIHPDAYATLIPNEGNWVIHIDTDFAEDPTLPDRFHNTPAWTANETQESSYGTDLARWAWKSSGYGDDLPNVILAELFNLRQSHADLKEEWFVNQLNERGLRSQEEFMNDLDNLSEAEQELLVELFDSQDPELYAYRMLKPQYDEIHKMSGRY
jgi:hypothetical protein